MAKVIESVAQLPPMLTASRTITLISVAWSPWPRKSRELLAALEATQDQWSPQHPIHFFDLWPERESTLNEWYDSQCKEGSPRFELHGHGYGPLWCLTNGKVTACLAKAYELRLEEVQQHL